MAAAPLVEPAGRPAGPGPPGGGRLMSETLAAKGAELATQALLLLLAPRALGPVAYGEFAVAFGAVSLAALGLGMGAPLAAIRYVPGAPPEERLALARALGRRVLATRALALAVLTVLAIAGIELLGSGAPWAVVVAAALAAWFSVGSGIASELALALNRTRIWNARFPLENGLVVVGALVGHAALGSHGAIVGIACAAGATFLVLAPRVLSDLRRVPAEGPVPAGLASYARLQTTTVLLFIMIVRGGPLTVIPLGHSSTQAGYAAIATGLAAAGSGVVMSLFNALLPRLSNAARTSVAGALEEARRAARLALSGAIAFSILAAALARPALDLTLGHGFAGARAAVVLALAAIPLGAVMGIASLQGSLRLRPGLVTLSWACGGIAFLVITAAAVPPLAARGASLALLGAFLAAALAATRLLGAEVLGRATLGALAGSGAILGAGLLTGAL